MSEKLKPCPFCGETPQLFDIGKLVCCESLTCSGNQFPMLIRQWETRPIEDALKAEHADALRRETMAIESQHELEKELERLQAWDTDVNVMQAATIARLKTELSRIATCDPKAGVRYLSGIALAALEYKP